MNRYVIRFDDIAPGMAWTRFMPLKAVLEQQGIRCVLGVVPDNRDEGLVVEPERDTFFDFVRGWSAHGDCIAQHGTHHVYDSLSSGLLKINARSEFAGHSYTTQLERLNEGKKMLVEQDVWQPVFMAPSHSFDQDTLRALKQTGFKALTDGFGFYPYTYLGLTHLPCLTARPLYPVPGVCTVCIHINTLSQQGSQKLLQFVSNHRKQIIDFDEALLVKPPISPLPSLYRVSTKYALSAIRRIRNSQE